MESSLILDSSFRDPSGFLFRRSGILYRQINKSYKSDYDSLMSSGLYRALTEEGLLIPHEEAQIEGIDNGEAYKVIKPQLVPFISYPYEWCFSQLKDAALLTLRIQKQSIAYGMSLKDCSAYNVQFKSGKPVFIDSLSFEKYREGEPWVAYRQFCQHFLAPLSLMSYVDIGLNQILRDNIDGVPLDLASKLLPLKTKFKFSLLSHIHLQAKSQRHFADKAVKKETLARGKMSKMAFQGIVESLEAGIKKLTWKPRGTEWADYYNATNYADESALEKKRLVSEFLDRRKSAMVWDLGANTGVYSRVASDKGAETISFDIDPACVEINYLEAVKKGQSRILPLLLDLTNPSPAIGWDNRERMSVQERGPADMVLALALIHHLAISNNLPLDKIAQFFQKISRSLIIEFVPKNDSQVQRLLASREDIFPLYTQSAFEETFSRYFTVLQSRKISQTVRTLYLMENRQSL